jgi:phosphoglycolate phosphatase
MYYNNGMRNGYREPLNTEVFRDIPLDKVQPSGEHIQHARKTMPEVFKAPYTCVIFDLDGTLVDTLADIAVSMNKALDIHGFPQAPEAEYLQKVGWGIHRLAFLALPPEAREREDAGDLTRLIAQDATRFYADQPLVYSKPYPGMRELVMELRQRQIKTAVLSNKPDPVARLVVEGLFPGMFSSIRGEREGIPRKPDPASAWGLLSDLGCVPGETVLLGDSEVDMETAHNAGCRAVAVSWGFRSRDVLEQAGPDRIIDRPKKLLSLMGLDAEPPASIS